MDMEEEHLSDEEKERIVIDTLVQFFDSLGENDIYKQVLLEEFFKHLMEKK